MPRSCGGGGSAKNQGRYLTATGSKFPAYLLVYFLDALRKEYGSYAKKILIVGLVGCRGDAYQPGQALSQENALAFHQFQIQALARAGVDFLIASTLPALSEAMGIAQPQLLVPTKFEVRNNFYPTLAMDNILQWRKTQQCLRVPNWCH